MLLQPLPVTKVRRSFLSHEVQTSEGVLGRARAYMFGRDDPLGSLSSGPRLPALAAEVQRHSARLFTTTASAPRRSARTMDSIAADALIIDDSTSCQVGIFASLSSVVLLNDATDIPRAPRQFIAT